MELFARIDNVLDQDYENFGLLGEDPTEVLPERRRSSSARRKRGRSASASRSEPPR
jgi:hypothetical protein